MVTRIGDTSQQVKVGGDNTTCDNRVTPQRTSARGVYLGESRDVAQGAADTAADVQHLLTGLDVQVRRQEVLVAQDGLVERLRFVPGGEVEALAPAVMAHNHTRPTQHTR